MLQHPFRRPVAVAVLIASTAALLPVGAPSAARADPVLVAAAPAAPMLDFKGPAGNPVDRYCGRHLADDTPAAMHLPNRALACQMQWTAARFGYAGPVDGRLGRSSWRGVQHYLQRVGTFRGHVTGRLDAATRRAIQRKAASAAGRFRDRGRIGGALTHAAWRGFADLTALPWAD